MIDVAVTVIGGGVVGCAVAAAGTRLVQHELTLERSVRSPLAEFAATAL